MSWGKSGQYLGSNAEFIRDFRAKFNSTPGTCPGSASVSSCPQRTVALWLFVAPGSGLVSFVILRPRRLCMPQLNSRVAAHRRVCGAGRGRGRDSADGRRARRQRRPGRRATGMGNDDIFIIGFRVCPAFDFDAMPLPMLACDVPRFASVAPTQLARLCPCCLFNAQAMQALPNDTEIFFGPVRLTPQGVNGAKTMLVSQVGCALSRTALHVLSA